MRRVWSLIGIVIAALATLVPLAWATVTPGPSGPMPWVIESAEYTGEIKEQIARMEARYTIRVIRDGWTEVPLTIQGATMTAIKIKKKTGEAHIAPRGGSYVLATSRTGTYKVLVRYSNLLTQDNQFEALQLGIPQATFSTMTLFVPRKDVELRPSDQLYVESEPDGARNGVKLTARLGAADRVDLRWRTKPASPVNVEPVLYGEIHTLLSIEEQLARLTTVIDYRMAQGETRELQIRLPAGLNLLNVRGAGIEDWRVADAAGEKTLTVSLGFPLKDTTYRLVLEGEQAIEAKSATYELPELKLVGVKQERGYLAVSRAGSIELSPKELEGINRVDVRELPDALRQALGTPVMLAFKYHQHPYRVALGLTRHEDHAVLAAIAEQGSLATVVSQQGELLTRAAYLIKANKKQFLEVRLPEGAQLWSCIVDGASVKPVEGSDKQLLVPLDAATDSTQTVSVELVYFEHRLALTNVGHMTLQGPILDVPTTIANWSVYAPAEVKFLRVGGNLERGMAPMAFLDEPFVQVAAATPPPAMANMEVNKPRSDREESSRRLVADRFAALNYRQKAGQGALKSNSDSFGSQFQAGASWSKDGEVAATYGRTGAAYGVTAIDSAEAPGKGRDDKERTKAFAAWARRLEDTGILPLKVRLPKSGTVYQFNRLMTTQDALTLEATFVHLPMPWVPFAALGLLITPLGGMVAYRVTRK